MTIIIKGDETEILTIEGPPGQNGYSPTVQITPITGGHQVSITDTNGVHSFYVMDGANGETGLKGDPGEDGKDNYQLYLESGGTLTQEQWLASLAQGAPEYAESAGWLEENGEQGKLYVLPNGHIWAWALAQSSGQSYTNLADPTSPDWADNKRINSSGAEVAAAGVTLTNYIPAIKGQVLRVKGLNWRVSDSSSPSYGNNQIVLYDGQKNFVHALNIVANNSLNTIAPVIDDIITYQLFSYSTPPDSASPDSYTITNIDSVAYIRVQGHLMSGYDKNSVVITINQEISDSEDSGEAFYQWIDTGMTYVPADNEARVAALENETAQLKVDVAALENGAVSAPPVYWTEAVDALADKIKVRQDAGGAKAFQFLWMSDIHGVNGYTNTNGAGTSITKDIGKTAAYALKKYDIPFCAISGDMMSQASHSSILSVYEEYNALHNVLKPITPNNLLSVMGNHDGSYGAAQSNIYYLKYIGDNELWNEIYRYQALDRNRIFGPDGSYFYVDSPQKVRFIMLNSQTNGDGSLNSDGNVIYNAQKNSVYGTEQLIWLSEIALNMPDDWIAIIMAHAPLNWSKDGVLLAGIITAYNGRTSYSGTANAFDTYWGSGVTDTTYTQISVSVDFTESKGEIAAFFHGHVHKDGIDSTAYPFPCLSITTAGGDVRDTNPQERIPGTSTETAMDIVTLDMENRKIYTTRLGVGSDRQISY